MFLHFQLATIAWLLLHFLDYSHQTTYGNFFPSVPGELTGQSFPVTLKTNTSSDLVIVKCPGSSYRHIKATDHFSLYGSSRERNLYYHTGDEVFAWTPVIYNSSGTSLTNCGKLLITKDQSSSSDNYEWTYNLNWEKQPVPMQIAEPHLISTEDDMIGTECNVSETSIVVYHKNKENDVRKFNLKDKMKAHVNDLFYYFQKPANDDEMEVKIPCVIIRAVNKLPKLLIKGHTSTPIAYKNLDIHVIKQKQLLGSYSIELSMGNEASTPDFYKGEEVKMKRMMFTRTGIEEIANSNEVITSSFSTQGYQLLKFSYDCPTIVGSKMISRIFYLGPESENYVFPNENTIYLSNETAIQPNCSLQRITFGYLDSVTVSGITTNLNDLMDDGIIKNGLKRVKDFVFMTDTKEDKVTLECFHVTPNGNVTFVETFLKGKKVVVGRNDKGEEIYGIGMEDAEREEFKNKLAEKNKELANERKTLFEKLKDKVGVIGAYALVIGSGLAVLIITLMIAIFCSIKIVKPWIIRKRIQRKHPNTFIFWDRLSGQNLKAYAETVQSSKYIPEKLKNQIVTRKVEGGEVVESNTNACFDRNLVKCFKDIDGEIKAHYISGISPIRTYIISDGPAPDKVEFFWELLYREDVAVTFAIIFQEHEMIKNSHSKLFYWPQKKERYGKVNVEFCGNIHTDIPFVTVRRFTMTLENGKPKKLIHFHISNWKEHDVPHSDRLIIKLYKEISEQAGVGRVLVHATHGSGSRVFMFTYFACIFEAMKENDTIDEPLEVIKEVRSQRYGGNISSFEYAYITRALATYFMESKLLVDITNHRLAFNDEYDDFIFKLGDKEANMDPDLKNFLSFVNIVDDGKLKDLCDQSVNVQMLSEVDLRLQCKRFFAISNMEVMSRMKIRYTDIPCLDKTSINVNGKGSMDIYGFIHANEFRYKYKFGAKERKIIMCQAPLKTSMNDMLDMIHRYKIGIIVVLVNKEEIDKGAKCFPYLLTIRKEVNFGAYNLLYRDHQPGKNNYFTEYTYSVIDKSSRLVHTFKLLHYLNWPDKTIPSERHSLHGLYKRIIELYDNTHIVIHCSAGIGRTGTLALIIYMIDVIKSKESFDPIKCLAKIRKHRCKAVQTTPQFVYALSILYEHFKGQIDRMDDKAYENFMSLADDVYYKSKNNIERKTFY
uniref:Protein-tyrosine-phosphatase n=1 Tax=Strongyloides stercoralis TaxID=6248 RepID=A0A0K0E145_STRER